MSSFDNNSSRVLQIVLCTNSIASSTVTKVIGDHSGTVVRRSANYRPPVWKYDYIQSLSSKYLQGDIYLKSGSKLKTDVTIMLDKATNPLKGLELIHDLQRLGVFYHFEEEIKRVLESIYNNQDDKWNKEDDLYYKALKFRLMRQHGYAVSQEEFKTFRDEMGNFKACICEDIKGLLYLYEATYLSIEGENILEEARDFTTKILQQSLENRNDIDEDLSILVRHALEVPLHWRMPRLEARWFIDMYERRLDMNSTLLHLAQLDFNMVQATHQEELKHLSRWWKSTGLGEKLSFARDTLVENFLWSVGMDFIPQIPNSRRTATILGALITVIDDIYDVYGTLDELELFTNAVERWDVDALEQLPPYMKICFLALFNTINEMSYDSLKEHGIVVISYFQKGFADLCKSYLVEARWYYNGYIPSFEEYMNNAWISIGIVAILQHVYVVYTNPITKEGLEYIGKSPDLIKWSTTIVRLADDLGTSMDEMKRGDIPKSIQCYMHETGASMEDARAHIKYLISEAWKKVNKARLVDSSFVETFSECVNNVARMAQCIYQDGDGHAGEGGETKEQLLSLLIDPIPIV